MKRNSPADKQRLDWLQKNQQNIFFSGPPLWCIIGDRVYRGTLRQAIDSAMGKGDWHEKIR